MVGDISQQFATLPCFIVDVVVVVPAAVEPAFQFIGGGGGIGHCQGGSKALFSPYMRMGWAGGENTIT